MTGLFDPLAAAYTDAVAAVTNGGGGNPAATADLSRLEGKLAWLVHIIGAVVKGRLLSSSSAEAQEGTDGDLAARAFALSRAADAAAPARSADRSANAWSSPSWPSAKPFARCTSANKSPTRPKCMPHWRLARG